jgi:pantothenate kinase
MRHSDISSQGNHDDVKESRSSSNHDIAVPTTIVGPNGRPLRVTWEVAVARDLAQRATRASQRRPYMVAVAGIPGSGKSSSAEILTHLINQEANAEICVCLPADGYHYTKERLAQLQVATGDDSLTYRRGAPDTFDVAALLRDLHRIREGDVAVELPGFDHAVGDPTFEQHVYAPRQHSIVLMEGLYLLHDQQDWQDVQQYFDYTIYIQTSTVEESMARVKERNVCIPGYTPEEISARVDAVDRRNAMLIEASSPSRASLVIGKNHGQPMEDENIVEG